MNTVYKIKNLINFISETMISKSIDNDDNYWKSSPEFLDFANANTPISTTNSYTIGIDSEKTLIIVNINSKEIDSTSIYEAITLEALKIKEQTEKIDDTFEILKEIYILFVHETVEDQVKLCNCITTFNIRYKIKNTLSLSFIPKAEIMYYLNKDIPQKEIKLKNIRRHETLTMPRLNNNINLQSNNSKNEKKNHDIKGYIFTANLYDIVDIYNQVGDEIFEQNVRMKIREQIGVDSAIQETLSTDPQYFWFRNNGITILMEEPGLIFDRANELVLKKANNQYLNFSIINGAQTITAAAQYYYGHTSPSDDEIAKAKDAQVILRIIHITNQKAAAEAKKISISLNRQKPIKIDDIAFANEFVDKINKYLSVNKKNYILIRRGERSYSANAYGLVEFARAKKACAGFPGEARSKATSELLKTKNDIFSDKDIFADKLFDSKNNINQELYDKSYSPVLFAMKFADKYETEYKRIDGVDIYTKTVIQNGKWYFISYVIYLLNGCNDQDYSNFNFSADKIKNDDFKALILLFAQYFTAHLKKHRNEFIDSNTFKNSEKYNELKETEFENSAFYSLLNTIFKDYQPLKLTLDPIIVPPPTGK